MKKRVGLLAIVAIGMLGMMACGKDKTEKITFVLDWTPNTNHTGVYVAAEQGYFEEAGLEVEIVQPPEDGATVLVASGKAQFGVDFQDYLAPAFATDEPMPITAVAAIIQHNTSGILSVKGNGMDTPAGMTGKTYATWDMDIEKAIIKHVVNADGGNFDEINRIPSTVTDVVTALQTDVDAVWVYYAWDGIATKLKGFETDFFRFAEEDPIMDFYSPVIIANNDYLKDNEEGAKAFLKAIKKGYEFAMKNPEEAANILWKAAPELDKELTLESQKWLADQYQADAVSWGIIDGKRWDNFYGWLFEQGLIEQEITEGVGYSNEYLQ